MAEAVTITAEPRDPAKNKGTGSRVSRKIRAGGRVPAIVYGHKQAPQPITLSRDDVWMMLKKGIHLAQIQVDGGSEMVLVRDIQWDHLGKEVLHMDFARVSADESIDTTVNLVLHGTAPGVAEGGVLEQPVHTVHVRCRANAIPDSIRIELGEVHLNGGVHVRELTLPEGVQVLDDPEMLLVHVVSRSAATEETAEGGQAQPEVIGRKAEDKEE